MVKAYKDAGLFEKWNILYIETHRQESKLQKAVLVLRSITLVVRAVLLNNVTLAHVHLSSGASTWRKLLFTWVLRIFGVRYLLHLHGGNYHSFYKNRWHIGRLLIGQMFRNAFSVLVVSPGWIDTVKNIHSESRVSVVPNFVEMPIDRELNSLPRDDNTVPVILFLGRLSKEKGVFDLVEALSRIELPFKAIIAGPGDINVSGICLDKLSSRSCIQFPGWVEGVKKDELLKSSDIFVLPSHFEAAPMAVLEAMSWGLPIVASSVGAIPEIVRDSEGLLHQPGAIDDLELHLRSLLTSKERRRSLGRSAQVRISSAYRKEVVIPALERVWLNGISGDAR